MFAKWKKQVVMLMTLMLVGIAAAVCMPEKILAADPGVWVNGELCKPDKTPVKCGSGSAVYDGTTKTLTLNNATVDTPLKQIVDGDTTIGIDPSLIYSNLAELKIEVVGTCLLDGAGSVKNGIATAKDNKTTIHGAGTLTIQGVTVGASIGGWDAGTLTLDSANMTITAAQYGLWVMGDLNVTDSKLSITTTELIGVAAHTHNIVKFKNSTITIRSKNNGMDIGDSGSKTSGVYFENCVTDIESQEGNAVFIWPFYNDANPTAPDHKQVFGTLAISGGENSTFRAVSGKDPKTGEQLPVTNQPDSSKIFISAGSTYNTTGAYTGYGKDVQKDNKIMITVSKTPVTGGTGEGGNGGSGEGGNGGNGGTGEGGNGGTGEGGNGGTGNGQSAEERLAQKGEDGTSLGKGASVEAATALIESLDDETEPAGTCYGLLQAKAKKTTNNSVKFTWKKVDGAVKYLVYAAKCGKGNKSSKVAEVTGTSYNLKKLDDKKINKGTYYKALIIAIDKDSNVLTTSKVIHAATTGGKFTNTKSITTNAKKNKANLKKGKSLKLKAKLVPQKKGLKIQNHRKVAYESSDTAIATVDAKGKIKAVGAGTCEVYVYVQNGMSRTIKVTVK